MPQFEAMLGTGCNNPPFCYPSPLHERKTSPYVGTATFLLGCPNYLLLNMSILITEEKCSSMVRDTDSGRQNNVSSNGVANTVPSPQPPQQKVDSGTTAANNACPKVHPPDGNRDMLNLCNIGLFFFGFLLDAVTRKERYTKYRMGLFKYMFIEKLRK
ncbi:hypothetical protein H5410_036492 [Solanum commersonii]|uniref:Uncharacterized protein n=1 Tax=Solanum commersonii TaxID=4109 RepID=A0A9J5Y7L8_SOLCO|nr:hypothetical protein H5410_036492 [Solanum commersonii]